MCPQPQKRKWAEGRKTTPSTRAVAGIYLSDPAKPMEINPPLNATKPLRCIHLERRRASGGGSTLSRADWALHYRAQAASDPVEPKAEQD